MLITGEFPNNIRANNIKTKSVRLNINRKKVYEKVLAVKSIHNSKDSLNLVFGFIFMLLEINFIFILIEPNFVLFALMLFGT